MSTEASTPAADPAALDKAAYALLNDTIYEPMVLEGLRAAGFVPRTQEEARRLIKQASDLATAVHDGLLVDDLQPEPMEKKAGILDLVDQKLRAARGVQPTQLNMTLVKQAAANCLSDDKMAAAVARIRDLQAA